MKVKLCGIKRPEDIVFMNEFLPDYVGFVFAGTKRLVSPEKAAGLAQHLDGIVKRVGVFVNAPPKFIVRTVNLVGLDVIQLHGDETAQDIAALRKLLPGVEIWKAVRVRDRESIPAALRLGADLLLLDSFSKSEYGGTGKAGNFSLIREANLKVPFFLAGGLNRENLRSAIQELSPYGVDISSGIETDGVKDRRKIEQIMWILNGSGKVGI